MVGLKVSIECELTQKNASELIEYFESKNSVWNAHFRKVFDSINHNGGKLDELQMNKALQENGNMQKRSATSIIKSAKGRYNAIKELKEKSELQKLKNRIEKCKEQIRDLEKEKAKNIENKKTHTASHRNLKKKLAYKKMYLNKLKQLLENLEKQIETGKFNICFGTKKAARQQARGELSSKKFIELRDRQICFIGSCDEPCRNSQFQMTYNPKNNQFMIKLRKDFSETEKNAKGNDRYVFAQVYVPQRYAKQLRAILNKEICSSITYYIIKKDKRYKLKIVYTEEKLKKDLDKCDKIIGIDFNAGFIAWTLMDKDGRKIYKQGKEFFRYGQGNATINDLRNIVVKFCKEAKINNFAIAIEDLDFAKTKGKMIKAKSKKGKLYNAMLSQLAYSIYKDTFERNSQRLGVCLRKVNPAYTSKNAKEYVCEQRKMNIHMAASYMIARRGLFLKDSELAN